MKHMIPNVATLGTSITVEVIIAVIGRAIVDLSLPMNAFGLDQKPVFQELSKLADCERELRC